jgi:hypothetical protein
MSEFERKLEGTFSLDGLLEGRTGPIADVDEKLRAWVATQRAAGLSFSLEVDGPSFSLLPSREPIRAAALGPRPADRVERAIKDVLAVLPAEVHSDVYSTLHSIEVRPNQEVQTVYAVAPDGSVRSEERIVDADTEAPPAAPTGKGMALRALASLGVLALLFAVSSIFVDWRDTFRSLWHQVSPVKADELAVDATAFQPWFEVSSKEVTDQGRVLALHLKRSDAFPRTFDGAPPTGKTWKETLALDALARGWVRAEIFDEKGKFIATADVRVAALRDAETATVEFPIPIDPRPTKVVLVP